MQRKRIAAESIRVTTGRSSVDGSAETAREASFITFTAMKIFR